VERVYGAGGLSDGFIADPQAAGTAKAGVRQRSGGRVGHPSVTQVKVTPHPMDFADACLAGSACVAQQGNRNLADFFEVRVDNTGAAMIVYDDMSNGLCQQTFGCPQSQILDHAGAGVVTIARQASGLGVFVDSKTGLPVNVSGPSNATVNGLADAAGDALSPLFGGTNIPQMDIVDNRISTSGQTLTITTRVAGDPRDAAGATTAARCPNCQLQFVTRWQMGNGLYYGMFETGPLLGSAFYGGATTTLDDCSVSACFPHVLVYPDITGTTEQGTINCPPSPSKDNPCTIVENINLADIGNPTNSSLLEEVGSYSFTSTRPQSLLDQNNERNDNGATEIDGVCCYNFQASGVVAPPPQQQGRQLPPTRASSGSLGFAFVILVLPAVLGLALFHRRRRTEVVHDATRAVGFACETDLPAVQDQA
jgi:hypothetical protein